MYAWAFLRSSLCLCHSCFFRSVLFLVGALPSADLGQRFPTRRGKRGMEYVALLAGFCVPSASLLVFFVLFVLSVFPCRGLSCFFLLPFSLVHMLPTPLCGLFFHCSHPKPTSRAVSAFLNFSCDSFCLRVFSSLLNHLHARQRLSFCDFVFS